MTEGSPENRLTPPAALVPEVSIREAQRGDLPRVLELYAQPGFDDGRVIDLARAVAIHDRMLSHPDYQLYVAEREGRIVGTFALLVMENLGHQGTPSAIIEDIAVDERAHRQGLGRAMVAHARELARAKGCYKLVLSSNLKREQAHAFYDALGFERHGYSYRVLLTPGT